MTAEIAILNKSAVALAADSAVTFSIGGERQVFQTVNKLFSLSKYHPVGVMVYGNAEFMDVDWETIVKIYRNALSKRSFDSLHEHAIHFVRFLQTNVELFDERCQQDFIERRLTAEFTSMRDDVLKKIHQIIEQQGKITSSEIRDTMRSVAMERHVYLRNHGKIKTVDGSDLSKDKIKEISKTRRATIAKVKKAVFEDLPTDASISRRLTEVAVSVLTREAFWGAVAGVVIAGYGKRQIFPALEEFVVEGVFDQVLKFRRQRRAVIGRENTAAIIPFAQSEMVEAFMEGVDPAYQKHIDETVQKTLDTYGSELLDLLAPNGSKNRDLYRQQIATANKKIARNTAEEMQKFRAVQFAQPVVGIVSALPKSELAAMAESLVNLTSFRRHVTPDAETVGGPIDVAVISRGDGFVWIKRKHYFQAELNQNFFTNYYREVSDDEGATGGG